MLELKNIFKSYHEEEILKDINLKFPNKGLIVILGPSGCGKTTLLNIIGGLTKPSKGEIILNGKSTKDFKKTTWDSYRNNYIGFIFQNYHLLNHLSVIDNISLKLRISQQSKFQNKALKHLKQVGLLAKKNAKPTFLSGGQKQRVAIARALVNDPAIILADEPTGALDSQASNKIMNLFAKIAQTKLVIMVTHNESLALKYATDIIRMQDGKVINDPQLMITQKSFNNQLSKTKLSIMTALKLSLKNLIGKKMRFFLTAFATSIGLIGLTTILSVSQGFNKEIKRFEQDSMANFPLIIQNGIVKKDVKTISNNSMGQLNVSNMIANKYHENKITNTYLQFINKIDKTYFWEVSFCYPPKDVVKMNNNYLSTVNLNLFGLSKNKFNDEFTLLAGSYPQSLDEIILIVNKNKEISSHLTESLALNKKKIKYQDILKNKLFLKNGNTYFTLNIVGVAMIKDESIIGATQFDEDKDNFVYLNTLDEKINKNIMPQTIYLYPKDLISKEKIINYLSTEKEIIFNDYAKELANTTRELIKMLTVILVIFSSVSLIVSALMISIIIYISVLERTKEIGILRCLGARSKDIKKIFLAEGLLIGIASTLLALFISFSLTKVINKILFHYLEIPNISMLTWNICLIILGLSVTLTLISSLIPANIASKKEPINSLAKE